MGPMGSVGGQRRSRRAETGSVTAETAVVAPLLAAFALCLCWLVSLGIAQVQLVDAARDGARAVARGEETGDVQAHVERTAPGADVQIEQDGDLATVAVASQVEAPGWLLVPLPRVTLRAESSVLAEEEGSDAMP